MIVVSVSGTARTHRRDRSGPRCHQLGLLTVAIVISPSSFRPTLKCRMAPTSVPASDTEGEIVLTRWHVPTWNVGNEVDDLEGRLLPVSDDP